LAAITTQIGNFNTKADYDTAFGQTVLGTDDTGADSTHSSDNIITAGLGNDVIVLGTSVENNETLVYNGYGNGTDSIVNFTAGLLAAPGADFIYFCSYGAVGLFLGGTVTAGVYAAGTLTEGVAAVALGEKYITVIEDSANLGSYIVQEWTETGALGFAGDVAQTIGVLDFGATQAFTADTFAI
jgi:hypothetical protein